MLVYSENVSHTLEARCKHVVICCGTLDTLDRRIFFTIFETIRHNELRINIRYAYATFTQQVCYANVAHAMPTQLIR